MVGDNVSISKALYGDQKLTRIAFPEAFNDIIGPPSFMTDKAPKPNPGEPGRLSVPGPR